MLNLWLTDGFASFEKIKHILMRAIRQKKDIISSGSEISSTSYDATQKKLT